MQTGTKGDAVADACHAHNIGGGNVADAQTTATPARLKMVFPGSLKN
jgi:hypothetical protein